MAVSQSKGKVSIGDPQRAAVSGQFVMPFASEVKIGGVHVAGHLVRSPEGDAVLDDKGLPIRLDYGVVTRVRI